MKNILLLATLFVAAPAFAYEGRRVLVREGGYINLAVGDPCWNYWTPYGFINDCPFYAEYATYYRPYRYVPGWWVGAGFGGGYGGYRRGGSGYRTGYRGRTGGARARSGYRGGRSGAARGGARGGHSGGSHGHR